MSEPLTSRSADLRRLVDDGYELEVAHGHLLVHHVPYVTPEREVRYGTLVSTLTLSGDKTTTPDTHVIMFAGQMPCDEHGQALSRIIHTAGRQELAEGITVDFLFSSKPASGYANYYEKVTAYVAMLVGPAQRLDGGASALTFKVAAEAATDSVFEYMETASARAGIAMATAKLAIGRVAIVGLGGTGGYVLDLLAKTPIGEIHIYDGDRFLQHNAFRAPGAPRIDVLAQAPNKAIYFQAIYKNMRRGIVAHDVHVTPGNVAELREMDFVFLCLDSGSARTLIVDRLEEWGVSFIDVGMGVYEVDGSLGGLVRMTASTPGQRGHIHDRIPFGEGDEDNDYGQNIQIAELNALNANLAVIKFKKLLGFFADLEHEHNAIYEIDGNNVINDDFDEAA